jgi:hypothetical protein
LSYLAFDAAYASQLLALGHADAMAKAEALVQFITSPKEDA